jgi:hypothetical protein
MLNIRIAAIFIEFLLKCAYIMHIKHLKFKRYGKSRTESRKLPKNLELSAFLCTFANER